jgi:hypothetical protein
MMSGCMILLAPILIITLQLNITLIGINSRWAEIPNGAIAGCCRFFTLFQCLPGVWGRPRLRGSIGAIMQWRTPA